MALRSGALRRPALLASACAILAAAAVLTVGWRSASSVAPSSLPPIGAMIADTLLAHLPHGGTVLAVSESCETCRIRAHAILRRLSSDPNQTLIVAARGGTTFRDLIRQQPIVPSQVLFVSPADLESLAGVRAVPTYVTVNAQGQVLASGALTTGWLGSVASPSRWLGAWQELLAGL